jgi:predicted O-linked N-acetylglucosamine transferase (SPINDLY family)
MSAAALLQAAVQHHQRGDLDTAETLYQRILQQQPNHPDALHLSGLIAHARGDGERATNLIRRAIRINERVAAYHGNLGSVLMMSGHLGKAKAALERALALDPGFADGWSNLASLHSRRENWRASADCYKRFLALSPPRRGAALALMALNLASIAAWDELEPVVAEMKALARSPLPDPIPPFPFLCQDSSAEEQLACARKQSAMIDQQMAPIRAALRFPPPPAPGDGRLVVGYLSNDYRQHATTSLIAELLELHDRARVKVVGISYGPSDGSAMRRRVEAACDRFMEVTALPPPEAARAIAAEGVHVLVDLKGYTADARPEILALRPAPVQVHYLGFPATIAAPFIDWQIVDGIIAPPGSEAAYGERLYRLPRCYQVNDRRRPLPDGSATRTGHRLPAEGMVFCGFNHPYKITRAVFGAWMRILGRVPGSVLWILEGDEALRRHAEAAGIDPGRLVFAPRLPPEPHMARHALADLFLDTLPVNAHTTASDALWAGLPVVTCAGTTFASRVAASLLHAVGLDELVAADLDDYVDKAVALAGDATRRAALKAHLEAQRHLSPLFDTPGMARDLEAAYAALWQEHMSR